MSNITTGKPFDLELAKAGAAVQTRDGRKVRIFAFDLKSDAFPIVGVICQSDGSEHIETWTNAGKYSDQYNTAPSRDLVMAPPRAIVLMRWSDNNVVNPSDLTRLVETLKPGARWTFRRWPDGSGGLEIEWEEQS